MKVAGGRVLVALLVVWLAACGEANEPQSAPTTGVNGATVDDGAASPVSPTTSPEALGEQSTQIPERGQPDTLQPVSSTSSASGQLRVLEGDGLDYTFDVAVSLEDPNVTILPRAAPNQNEISCAGFVNFTSTVKTNLPNRPDPNKTLHLRGVFYPDEHDLDPIGSSTRFSLEPDEDLTGNPTLFLLAVPGDGDSIELDCRSRLGASDEGARFLEESLENSTPTFVFSLDLRNERGHGYTAYLLLEGGSTSFVPSSQTSRTFSQYGTPNRLSNGDGTPVAG